jgi:hypothetical protein
MDKIQQNLEHWCSGEGIKFIDTDAEEKYKKKAQRISDAIQLKVPDRVPVTPYFGMFTALSTGITCEEFLFDSEKSFEASKKTMVDFDPDLGGFGGLPAALYEAIDYKALKLPGRGVPVTSGIQFVEDEYVTAEEFYDQFIFDPTDFMLRTFLPRVVGMMEPLKILPPLNQAFSYYLGLPGSVMGLSNPQIGEAFSTVSKAIAPMMQRGTVLFRYSAEPKAMGYPGAFGSSSHAPFDTIGDFIRGTRGIMLDMYRRPEKLLAALEKMVPIHINLALQRMPGAPPFVFFPLHKGAEGFMSLDQYKRFYWPTLRKVMMACIEEGLVPSIFFEGENTSRLEVIKDIPRGKAIYHFDRVDIKKAKEILGDTVCFQGNVPVSYLATGTVKQVKDYVKNLIDVVGVGGGLIVDSGAILDEAKYENVKAMVEFTKEYGVY